MTIQAPTSTTRARPTHRILFAIASVLAATALLGAAVPCAALCSASASMKSAATTGHAGDSHCARKGATPPAEAEPPCGDDCTGFEKSRLAIPSAGSDSGAAFAHGPVALSSPAPLAPRRAPASSRHEEPAREDPPPRDVLALTTILLI